MLLVESTSTILNVSVGSMLVERERSNVKDYSYRSRAVTSVGFGPWSSITLVPNDFTNVASSPANVTIDTSAGVEADSFVVRWTLPVADKNANASFQLRLTPTGNSTGAEVRMDTAMVDEACTPSPGAAYLLCEHRVATAQPYTEYTVSVAAENAFGTSLRASASNVVATPAGFPEPPEAFQVASVATDSLGLTWLVPRGNGNPILGYVLSIDDGRGAPTAHAIGANAGLVGYGSCASLAASAVVSPPQGTPLAYTLTNLTEGTSFVINVTTCNGVGASRELACVCAEPRCYLGCVREPYPAHTLATPDLPTPPAQVADPDLAPLQTRTLFVTWSLPFSHGKPVLEVEARVGNQTFAALINGGAGGDGGRRLMESSISATQLNVSGLEPATLYGVSVRFRNAIGWGVWSETAFLSTRPEKPDAPPTPFCDPDGNRPGTLKVDISAANSNGLMISDYEVRVGHVDGEATASLQQTFGVEHFYTARVPGNIRPLLHLVTAANVSAYARAAFGGNATLSARTAYNVTVRARNGLGWSEWSDVGIGCATTRTWTYFDLLVVVVPLAVGLCLCCCCVVVWRCTEVRKIVAPRTHKKELNTDPLEDFIVKEDTALEDLDPDLTVNPVLLAKMVLEKETYLKKKRKAAKGGATGGLKRLGLNLDGDDKHNEIKPVGLKDIDIRLQVQAKEEKEARRKAREEVRLAQKELQASIAIAQGKAHPSEFVSPRSKAREAEGPAGSSRQSPRRDSIGEIDIIRTLTVRTKTKREKHRAYAADRMVAQAQAATLRADRAKIARAAAHLPSCRESGEEEDSGRGSRGGLPTCGESGKEEEGHASLGRATSLDEMSTTPARVSARL